ncbi:MAG: ribosomal protein S18-alanine N-acetyltransferase [Candidatus Zixiibacteriota bacterium]
MLKELDQITVQRMTHEDLDEIARLEKICFSDPWNRKCFEEELEHQFCMPLVVRLDHQVVGYACLWHVDEQMEIANFAVSPEFRRRGIGRRLMEEVLLESRERGCTSVILSVRESNLSAKNLYEEFGYVEVGRRKRYYRYPVEDAVIMVKEL